MTDYTPIDCGKHSEYELAIMQGRLLRLSWQDGEGQAHIAVLLPLDLLTRNHEEFLVGRDEQDNRVELRLDYIIKIEAL